MASKHQYITGLYEHTLGKITSSPDAWMEFLRSACRNYKCRFDEQALIYVQRPDATAVLEIEKWNRQFGRWVNKGAKGIAVFDDGHLGSRRLRHYFDVSDTHESGTSRPVHLWVPSPGHEPEIIESLQNSFGDLYESISLEATLISAASSATAHNITDYLSELLQLRVGSALDGMDSINLEVRYRTIVANSVAYMLLARCGIDPAEHIGADSFKSITDYNTTETANTLGLATSDISEMILRDIAATVINAQKREQSQNRTFANSEKTVHSEPTIKNTERGERYGTDIPQGGRLPHTEPDDSTGAENDTRQIRTSEAELPHEQQAGDIPEPENDRQTDGAPSRNRAGGNVEDGTADIADGTGGGRDGETESGEPDEVGGVDEQYTFFSGGNYTERPDILIAELPTVSQQMALLGEAEELKSSAFSISQQIIDEVLTSGGNENDSTLRIAAYFKKDKGEEYNATFLRNEYGTGGKGFIFDSKKVSVWFSGKGIHIAMGDTVRRADAVLVTWEQTAQRVRELLDLGRYMPQSELDKVDANERKDLAESLWHIHKYLNEGAEFPFLDDETFKGGFTDSTERIALMMADPKQRKIIYDGMRELLATDTLESPLFRLNFAYNHLPYFLTTLASLEYEPLEFTADDSVTVASPNFITQDEVDKLLQRGSSRVDSKFRIYSFFLGNPTDKEKADFLKSEFGTGGFTYTGYSESHDSKGILFSRGNSHMPYDKVTLPWTQTAKLIDKLITDNRYISPSELERIPQYEKEMLAREINAFYYDLPEDISRPYPFGTEYKDAADIILPQLDDEERVAEILEQMESILDDTHETDSSHEKRTKAFNSLTAYENGEYTLFPAPGQQQTVKLPQVQATKQETAAATDKPPPAIMQGEITLRLGDTVHIGTSEFEVASFNDVIVSLIDTDAPLFSQEMLRSEFDIKVSENPLNSNLFTQARSIDETKESAKSQVSDELYDRGFVVSGEAIDDAFEEYSVRGGKGNIEDIADFVEDEYLSEEPERSIEDNRTVQQPETLMPSWETSKERQPVQGSRLLPDIQISDRHNFRITDDDLGVGGQKTKFRANIEALKTLQAIEGENRLATPEEQETLSRYVGWGALPQAFDGENTSWTNEHQELKTLLTEDEFSAARASTLNAHYTSPTVIKAIYKAIENVGFKTGNILEPSCGVGNFLGLLPESMGGSSMYGVELDSLTGRIAQQLYQKSNIAVQGFETTDLPDSFFDLAIGNVPFGSYKVLDKKYDKHKFSIHDYFFAKTIDKVRPGGIVAFVTSMHTLDKQNNSVRKYIAQRTEFLGAIRLPNNAFMKNAGTEVTSDIIFLQKRDKLVDIEPDWVHLGKTEEGFSVNSYFIDHPEMVLGRLTNESGTRLYGGENSISCEPFPDAELSQLLSEAIVNIHAEYADYERDGDDPDVDNSIPADPSVRNFSYTLVDGKIFYRQDSRMIPVEMSVTAQSRVRGLIGLRDCVRKLVDYQTENYPDSSIVGEQTRLNRLYDAFTKKYGLINSRGNSMAFAQDSAYCLLCALEVLDENGELERKADMFTKRTIKPYIAVTHVDTATEALAVSLSERAIVDLDFMSELTGKAEDTLIEELDGIIFSDVGNIQDGRPFVTADEYLSGNVREKLRYARDANEEAADGRFLSNVKALEAVMPEDLTAAEISVRLGATWVPESVIQEFMQGLFKTTPYIRGRIRVHYSRITGTWSISNKTADRSNIHVFNTFGTKRINAYQILENTLNLRDVRIFDKTKDAEGNEKRVLNKKETAIALAKQEQICQRFDEWVWTDPDRREHLCRIYNDRFNSFRPREYDGSHLKFPGMNPEVTLRKHQINAIARIIYGGNTLLAHEVGAGKTFEMVAAAVESKRLGLCNKSLIVVPNHITEQWAGEFLQLYPSANLLVATRKDFETKNRKKFCARIATGDYDAIVIGHTQFEKIPISHERQKAIIDGQIQEIMDGIEEMKAQQGDKSSVKQLERVRKSLELKLAKLNDQSKKDDVVTFEELGIDKLFIDESHYYKNLFLITKMRNVGGVPQTEAQKSSDLFAKCLYLNELTNKRGVIFATGTPISNSMVEMYTIQRYLQYELLVQNGLQHFDAWASTFGETITAIELAPEGTGYRAKTRFAKFYNLPELMSMFRSVADIQTADMLMLPVPDANFHTVVSKPSVWQKEMISTLAERAGAIRDGNVDPTVDNMLKVTNDGRKLALDQRIINPMLPDDPEGKVSRCVENVFRIWDEHKEQRLTQLVFSDLSTPKSDGSFSVYNDIRDKLIARGVPENEVAFIHSADTETKKKELFAKVRKGQVRVLIGSTQKMGAGTNVQDKLIALHDLDCPWRPSDLAQRLGRIIRQGNKNPVVEIFRYVTEGTFDSYLYQLVENKQKFISQIMTSKLPVRSAEDIDETALSYAEIKALATGNPLIIEKCQLEMDVGKLKILHASHLSQKYSLEDKVLKEYPREITRLTERIEGYKTDIATVLENTPEKGTFPSMMIGGKSFTEKGKAGMAILEACKNMQSPDPIPLGEYRGFSMTLAYDSYGKTYKLVLQGQLSHDVTLGTDTYGNITRIDNALENTVSKRENCEKGLADVKIQLETAQGEQDRPFPQEQEYAEKSARLKEVDILLNMDEKNHEIIGAEPDEGDLLPVEKSRGMER